MPAYTMTVEGVPYTLGSSAYDIGTLWQLQQAANGAARLTCRAIADVPSAPPQLDDEIVLLEDGVPIFGGYVLEPRTHGFGGAPTTEVDVDISANDYHVLALRRSIVTQTVPAGSLASMLTWVLSYLDGVTLHPSQLTGPTLAAIPISVWTVQQLLDYLSTLTLWIWRIDALKRLQMIQPGTEAAPFDLNATNVATVTINDVIVTRSRIQNFANYVYVMASGGVIGTASDSGSITQYGRHDLVVEAPDITTQASADALATSILAQSAITLQTVEYDTEELGLAPGQTQTINLPARGINNLFLLTEVNAAGVGARAVRSVKAIEGVTYQAGWREVIRTWGGGTSGITIPGLAGGTLQKRYAIEIGGDAGRFVESAVPTWTRISPRLARMSTAARGTQDSRVVAQVMALSPGVSIQLRLFNVNLNTAVPNWSAVITATDWTSVTFAPSLQIGDYEYALEILPGAANEQVGCVAYVE